MSERSGQEQPSDEELRRHSDVSPDQARQMGWTNSDYMRYRLSEERPIQDQQAMEQTRLAQLNGANHLITPHAPEQEDQPLGIEAPETSPQEDFSQWSARILDRLGQRRPDDSSTLTPEEASALVGDVRLWASRASSHLNMFIGDTPESHQVQQAARRLDELAEDPGLTADSLADILDAKGYIGHIHLSERFSLKNSIDRQPVEVLAQLMSRNTVAGLFALVALESRSDIHRSSPEEIADIAVTSLQPMATRLSSYVAERGGLQKTEPVLGFLEKAVHATFASTDTLNSAQSRGFDRLLVTNSIVDALSQDIVEITRERPTHYQCISIIDTIGTLYPPEGVKSPPKLADLLHRLYQSRVKDSPHSPDKAELSEKILRLASKTGIPVQDLIGQ